MHVQARLVYITGSQAPLVYISGSHRQYRACAQVSELVDEVEAEGGGEAAPAQSPAIQGTWRLRWSAQVRPPRPGSVLQAEPRKVSGSGLRSANVC